MKVFWTNLWEAIQHRQVARSWGPTNTVDSHSCLVVSTNGHAFVTGHKLTLLPSIVTLWSKCCPGRIDVFTGQMHQNMGSEASVCQWWEPNKNITQTISTYPTSDTKIHLLPSPVSRSILDRWFSAELPLPPQEGLKTQGKKCEW